MNKQLPRFALIVVLFFGVSMVASGAQWRSKAPDRQKSAISASQETLLELLTQLESLQAEVQQLRNQTEVHENEIKRLRSRLQDVTSDLDRRVSDMERRGGAGKTVGRRGKKAPPSQEATGAEQKRYDAAFQLMKQGDYTGASRAFRGFIARYSGSPLAANAQYWIAESNYFVHNYRLSLKEFRKLLSLYPNSRKVADAMLKIGYTHYELGEWTKARRALQELMNRYPRTRNANSAKARLRIMKNEGH